MIIINDNFIIPFLSLNDFLSDTHDRVKFRLEWSLEQKKAGLQNNTLEKNLSIGTLYPKKTLPLKRNKHLVPTESNTPQNLLQ